MLRLSSEVYTSPELRDQAVLYYLLLSHCSLGQVARVLSSGALAADKPEQLLGLSDVTR